MEGYRKVAMPTEGIMLSGVSLKEEIRLYLDGALENLGKRVPKVKVGNRESLRQKDSVDIYNNT